MMKKGIRKLWGKLRELWFPLLDFARRVFYAVKRMVWPIAIAFGAWILLVNLTDNDVVASAVSLAFTRLFNLGVGVFAALLISKFVFPKLSIQETVKDNAIATAILAAGIFLAISNFF
jgi:hypothetical protein